jgi:hypothetical protein
MERFHTALMMIVQTLAFWSILGSTVSARDPRHLGSRFAEKVGFEEIQARPRIPQHGHIKREANFTKLVVQNEKTKSLCVIRE